MTRLIVLLASAASLFVPAGAARQEPAGAAASAAAGDPVAMVRAYLASREPAERGALAGRIAAHRDYRPARLRAWLHEALPFEPQPAGIQPFDAFITPGLARRVYLVVPPGYRPDRAWPLIYALHPSGEPAERWAGRMQQMLGTRAREFLIASPEYVQNSIEAGPPVVAEHAAILDAVARRLHVDAGRVYPFGYSKGGFAAWYIALYFPDRVAAAISTAAGFDVAPADDDFWKALLPNVAHVPVLNVWGEHDPLVARALGGMPAGTFAESNRLFARAVSGLGLPITNLEIPGGAHNGLASPSGPILEMLSRRRSTDPARVAHVFRHLHQASCYWLEGVTWVGDVWGDARPTLLEARPGESTAATLGRTLEPLLGRLTGEIAGQTIRVTRRHIGDVIIWFGEDTVDWRRPVTVVVDGRIAFTGRLTPDVGVALARAAATMDFEVLRFAGLRVDAAGQASLVTAETMSAPAWGRAAIR